MLDNYQDLIDGLIGTPSELQSLLGDPVPANLPPTTVTLLAELRDRDQIVLRRLQTLTRQPNPHLRAIETEPAPTQDQPAAQTPAEILTAFNLARGDLISLLMNLTLRDWERTATHDTAGHVTLADEVEQHLDFDEAQQERIREERGAAPS